MKVAKCVFCGKRGMIARGKCYPGAWRQIDIFCKCRMVRDFTGLSAIKMVLKWNRQQVNIKNFMRRDCADHISYHVQKKLDYEKSISGTKEGEVCNRSGCKGVLHYPPVEDCSCHARGPCWRCENNVLTCSECGYHEKRWCD